MKYLKFLGIILTFLLNVNTMTAQDVGIKVNGICDTIVKGHDTITLSLPENYNSEKIDSIKWFIHFNQTNNQEYTCFISDQITPTFINKPQMFNCYFSQAYPKQLKGFDWGSLKEVYPFDCYFSCNIYTASNLRNNITYLRTENIKFDVLPQTPVVTLERVWTPIEGDEDYPVAQIHVVAGDFEEGMILVEQSKDNLPPYADTLFTAIPFEGFVVSLGSWNNGILCWVRNEYGHAMSDILSCNSSNIHYNTFQSDILLLNGKGIIVNPLSKTKVCIFDNRGIVESEFCTDKRVSIPLKEGLHLIKLTDKKTNVTNNYKIYIK